MSTGQHAALPLQDVSTGGPNEQIRIRDSRKLLHPSMPTVLSVGERLSGGGREGNDTPLPFQTSGALDENSQAARRDTLLQFMQKRESLITPCSRKKRESVMECPQLAFERAAGRPQPLEHGSSRRLTRGAMCLGVILMSPTSMATKNQGTQDWELAISSTCLHGSDFCPLL